MIRNLIGEKFGDYELTALLGEGPIGRVFSARHTHTGPAPVAVKIIHAGIAGKPEFRHRFPDAVRDLQMLRHEHILRVMDYADHAELPYLVMDQATGGSLAALIALAAYQPIELTTMLIRQAAEGLAFAHRQGIVHGSLKPANLLLFKTGAGEAAVRVADFGLAEASGLALDQIEANAPYLAPEQWRGDPASARGDVYALGAVLYEALTGERPFASTRDAHLNTPPRPPRELRRELPEELERIVLRCLAKAPGERYESAAALAEDLRVITSLVAKVSAPASSLETSEPPAEWRIQPRRHDPTIPPPPHNAEFPPPPPNPLDRPCVYVFTEQGVYNQYFYLKKDLSMVGREPKQSDLVLESDAVSPRHLCIEYQLAEKQIVVTDLDSENGVYLEGQCLEANVPHQWDQNQWMYVRPYWLCWRPPAVAEDAIVLLPADASQKLQSLTLPLGQQTICRVMVRNNGRGTAAFSVRVTGEIGRFAAEEQTPVLQPGQSANVSIKVAIPQGPDCLAGIYNLTIVATSEQYKGAEGKLPVEWTVPPFFHSECTITPATVRGRTQGKYTVRLKNLGNTADRYTLRTTELEEEVELDCRFGDKNKEKRQHQTELAPGKQGETIRAVITAPRRWFGVARSFNVPNLIQAEHEQKAHEQTIKFFHKAVFPVWLLIAVPAAIVAIWFALFWLMPPVILSVATDPEKLAPDQAFLLTVRAKNARRVVVQFPSRVVDVSGSQFHFDEGLPKGNHSATIIVSNFLGQTTQRTHVFKVEPSPIRILRWEASTGDGTFGTNLSVRRGQTVTFYWQVAGATKLSATGLGILQPIALGEKTLPIPQTAPAGLQEYKLVASNGPDLVEESPTPVNITITESPVTITNFTLPERHQDNRSFKKGDTVSVTWDAANAVGFILKVSIGNDSQEPRQYGPADRAANVCLNNEGNARITLEAIGKGEGNVTSRSRVMKVAGCLRIKWVRECKCK